MLCTPPAFILSQDQTLEIIVLKLRYLWDPIFLLSSLALSFFYFCWVVFSSVRIFEIRFAHTFFSALYFSLVVQFSKIIFASRLATAFCGDLVIIPLSLRFVKYFFKTFFKFFSSRSLNRSLSVISARSLADSLYIILHPSAFVKHFFQLFLLFSLFWWLHQFFHDISYDIWAKILAPLRSLSAASIIPSALFWIYAAKIYGERRSSFKRVSFPTI